MHQRPTLFLGIFQAGRRQQVRDARQEGGAPHQRRGDAPVRHDPPGGPAARGRHRSHLLRRPLPGRSRGRGRKGFPDWGSDIVAGFVVKAEMYFRMNPRRRCRSRLKVVRQAKSSFICCLRCRSCFEGRGKIKQNQAFNACPSVYFERGFANSVNTKSITK